MELPKRTMNNLSALTNLSKLKSHPTRHNLPESYLEALEIACDVLAAIEVLCIPVHGKEVAND